jgi:hypothetical protein
MTETEWLRCSDSLKMLEFLRSKTSDRKFRLFACGCCRHVWDRLPSDHTREAVEVTERIADGLVEDSELGLIWHRLAEDYELDQVRQQAVRSQRREKVTAALTTTYSRRPQELAREVAWETSRLGVRREERQFQVALLCCIVGNPFRPSPPLPHAVLGWNDGTVRRIAEGIYEERAFDRLPVLHDALLDAGCDDEAILAHCRGAGPHVRGCWVIDLILGKE